METMVRGDAGAPRVKRQRRRLWELRDSLTTHYLFGAIVLNEERFGP
jgi:hypothetical protein